MKAIDSKTRTSIKAYLEVFIEAVVKEKSKYMIDALAFGF